MHSGTMSKSNDNHHLNPMKSIFKKVWCNQRETYTLIVGGCYVNVRSEELLGLGGVWIRLVLVHVACRANLPGAHRWSVSATSYASLTRPTAAATASRAAFLTACKRRNNFNSLKQRTHWNFIVIQIIFTSRYSNARGMKLYLNFIFAT